MSERAILREPLHAVAERIERREFSPVELTELSLGAILEANPTLNAYRVVTAERAMAAARAAEQRIAAGHYQGALHGIPLAVKDLMDMAGETTPAGSKVLADTIVQEDSTVVRLWEAAGAAITGKTHMPEFAYNPSSVNPHYGPVRNPWDLDRDTAGSSSGSGAALAACLVYGATGSDTGGSIRMPAAVCGLVGLKPTYGRVSAHGAQTLAWSLDHIGPMARTVRDTALLLNAMAGYDARDVRTARRDVPDYAADLDVGVAGLRVAWVTDDGLGEPMGTPGVLDGVSAAVRALADAGAQVEEMAAPEVGDLWGIAGGIFAAEGLAAYEPFLRERPDDLGAPLRDRLLVAYAYSPATYLRASQARAALRRAFEERVRGYDLVVMPGMPTEAPPLATVRNNTRFTTAFNHLGWPAICVPAGLGEGGLPVSLQIAAQPWQERLVLQAARVVERDGPWQGRIAPFVRD